MKISEVGVEKIDRNRGKPRMQSGQNTAVGGGEGCLMRWECVMNLQQEKDSESPDAKRPKQGNPTTNGEIRKKPTRVRSLGK
jgi:hypothetical protein